MKTKRIFLALAGITILAAMASSPATGTPTTIEAEGTCHQRIPVGTQRLELETIDLNRMFTLGLNVAQRALARTAELLEQPSGREVEGGLDLTIRDPEAPTREVRVPFRMALPRMTAADFENFANYVVGDPSEFENLVQFRTDLGISEEEFSRHYEACMRDAVADARTRAGHQAEARGLTLGELISADANVDASEAGRYVDLRLTIQASFSAH